MLELCKRLRCRSITAAINHYKRDLDSCLICSADIRPSIHPKCVGQESSKEISLAGCVTHPAPSKSEPTLCTISQCTLGKLISSRIREPALPNMRRGLSLGIIPARRKIGLPGVPSLPPSTEDRLLRRGVQRAHSTGRTYEAID